MERRGHDHRKPGDGLRRSSRVLKLSLQFRAERREISARREQGQALLGQQRREVLRQITPKANLPTLNHFPEQDSIEPHRDDRQERKI
jgi:hypothetical protein